MELPLLLPAPQVSWFQRLISWTPTVIGGFFLAVLLVQLMWPVSPLLQAVRQAQRWPQFPSTHFALAKALVANGYETAAETEYLQGEQQVETLNRVFLGRLFLSAQTSAQKSVFQKQALQDEQNQLTQALVTYPYAWELVLQKAVLHYQLYEDKQAQENIQLATWLNPGNATIKKITERIQK